MNSISVIIVTYNAMSWTERCLLPLKELPVQHRVYIIDNGSTDGTQEFIKERCPAFKFYQSEQNLGFGKANNIGLKMALEDECTHFLLLNQDAHIKWKDITSLADLHKRNPEYGIISPLQLYDAETVDFLHLKSLMKQSFSYINDLICANKLSDIYDIGYTNAAIWMLSRECLRKVGGFDPLFPHYGEDNDYSMRVNYFGLKVGLAPHIRGYHFRNQLKTDSTEKTENVYFTQFLVRVKNMNANISVSFFRILSELFRSSIGRVIGRKGLANNHSWKAFFRVLKLRSKIKRNIQINKSQTFSYLSYKD